MNTLNRTFFVIIFFISALAFGTPDTTNFQAHISKPDGTDLESNAVTFTFKYLNEAGTCTLYTETYAGVDMSGSGGDVSIQLGSGAPSFPVAGFSLKDILSNATTNTMNCVEGGNYTPTLPTEKRKFVVEFSYAGSNGTQTLPAADINSVPYSMYAGDAANLGGFAANTYARFADVTTCAGGQFLTFNGTVFSCAAPGAPVNFTGALSGDVTGTQSATVVSSLRGRALSAAVPASGEYLGFDGTTWVPMAIAGAAGGTVTLVTSANLYLSVASSSTTPVLTVNVGQAANTVAAGDDARIVGAWQSGSALSGDVTGTLAANVVSTVGGKTAAQVNTSVNDTLAATSANTASTIVKRDASGDVTVSRASAVDFAGRNFLFYDSGVNKITVKSPNALTSGDYTLTLPDGTGTNGYVLSTNGAGVTSWIPAATGSVTNVTATAPVQSSGGATPNISLARASSGADGYLASTDWTTFNNKVSSQWATSTDTTSVYYNGGSVGIGTTTPALALQVNDGIYSQQAWGTGTTLAGNIHTSGSGDNSILLWYPRKGSFVAGEWDSRDLAITSIGGASAAFNYNTRASGYGTFAAGNNTTASADYSAAFGNSSSAYGYNSMVMGTANITRGNDSLAGGNGSEAIGDRAMALGNVVIASGDDSFATGLGTVASGDASFAMGDSTIALGYGSLAQGWRTRADSFLQVTIGKDNLPVGTENKDSWVSTDPLFVIGNGTGIGAGRRNALMLLKNGQMGLGKSPSYALDVSGDVNVTGNFKINGTNINAGTVTSVDVTAPLQTTGGATPNISLARASSGADGYLASTDWTTFNSKQAAGSYITQLSGDVTGTGPGITTATLATITSAGTVGSASAVPTITYDAKGRITGTSSNAYQDATGATKGIVQVGNNINVAGGVISVATASSTTTGVLSSADFSSFSTASSKWTQNASGDIYRNTNVGIGTNSPNYDLDIYSAGSANSYVRSNSNMGSSIISAHNSVSGKGLSLNQFGSMYMGLYNGILLWDVSMLDSSGSNLFIAYRNGDVRFLNSSGETMRLTDTGRLGIGNQGPAYAVDVSGDVNVTGNFKVNGVNINSGTVTNVTASVPLASSGGATPNITLAKATAGADGYLASTDWTTFNNKQNTLVKATAAADGYLASTDWTTFNNKQSTLAKATAAVSGYLASADFSSFANKVSSQWTTSTDTTSVFYNGGNVGIGTAAPTHLLEVRAPGVFNQNLILLKDDNETAAFQVTSDAAMFGSTLYMGDVGGLGGTIQLQTYGTSYFSNSKVGIGTTAPVTNARLAIKDGHLQSQQTTAPNIAVGAGNTGGGAACSLSNATDMAGKIVVTGGNTNSGGVLCDITFNKAFTTAPIITISPCDQTAASENGNAYFYTTSTTTTFALATRFGVTGFSTSTICYHVIETQ